MKAEGGAMSLCAYCGQDTQTSDALCVGHTLAYGQDWAMGNRIMCDFLHRDIVSPRPTGPVRSETNTFEWIPWPPSHGDEREQL